MKDKAAKAAYDKARWARLRVDRRPPVCAACGGPNKQPVHGWRKFCSDLCRGRAFYRAHPGYGYVPVAPVEPLPMPYVGHPIFEQAMQAAGLDRSPVFASDWGQHDLLGVATLAILEGEDPRQAVRAFRAREKSHTAHAAHHVIDVGADGDGTIIVQKEYDAA